MRATPASLFAVLCLSAAPVLAQDVSLEEIAPADVFAFARFAGLDACSEAADGLDLYRLWREPEMQDFVAELIEMFDQVADQTPREFMEPWSLVKSHFSGEISLILGDLTLIWTNDGPIPMPGAVLALEVGGDRAAFEQLMDGLIEQGGSQGIERWTEERHGVQVHVFRQVQYEPMLSIHYAWLGDRLLVGLNGHLLNRCIDNYAGVGGATLADSGPFARSRQRVEDGPLLELYLNVDAFSSRLGGLMPVEVHELMHTLGIDGIAALYYGSSVHDGSSFDTCYIDTPGPHRGLLAISDQKPLAEGSLQIVPRDAAYFMAMSFDAAAAWDTVWDAIEGFAPPREVAFARHEVEQAEEELGFRIRDGLLACLGDEFVAYAELPQNGLIPNVVASIELDDAETAAKIISVVLNESGADWRQLDYQDVPMFLINVDDAPISPCFSVLPDRVLISLTVGGLKATLRSLSEGRPSVIEAENFQQAVAGLEWREAHYLQYLDLKRLAGFGYNMAEGVLPGLDPGDVPVDLAMLPSQNVVLRHIGGVAEVGTSDAHGFVFKARSPSIATVLALGGRFLMEAPGFPLYPILVMAGEVPMTGGHGGGGPISAPAEPRPPAPPAGIVNPVAEGSPEEAALLRELEGLNAFLADNTENGGAYFQRGLVNSQLRRFESATADYLRSRQLGNALPTCAYNIACTYSLQNKSDMALDWLEVALQEGFTNWNTLDNDSDINAIRGHQRYGLLMVEYRGDI